MEQSPASRFVDVLGRLGYKTQQQIADLLQIARPTAGTIVRQERDPSFSDVARLKSEHDEVNIDYIFTGKGSPFDRNLTPVIQLPPQVPSKFEEAEPGKQIMIVSHSLETMLAGMTSEQRAAFWRNRYETDIEQAHRREQDLLDRLAKKLDASPGAAAPQPFFESYVAAPTAARLIGPRFDEPVVLDFYTGQRKAA